MCRDSKKWSIDAPEFNNCFWEMVRETSDVTGYMPPISQIKTMTLLKLPPAQAQKRVREALSALAKVCPTLE